MGRAAEQERLVGLLDGLADGHGSSLSLVGPAGTGKTSLVAWLGDEAERRGCAVSRVSGVESETDLPWAALGSLCLPHQDLFDRLPGPQVRALRSAFALAEIDRAVDRLAVSLGALGVLSAAAREQPLVVLVDDLHWLDPESRRALEFIARRVADDPIALLLAGRPEGESVPGPVVQLHGLDDPAVDQLLQQRGVRSEAARSVIAALVDGNPLLAAQVADGLSDEERAGTRAVTETLRVPAEVEELFRPRLAALCPEALEALAVVAADTSGSGPIQAAALQALGRTFADLEEAERVGLVSIDRGSAHFTHPVARTAVYQVTSGPVRRRAHAALADAERTPAQAVLHRAAATVGQDAALADELGALALDAYKRGAPVAATNRCVQAAAFAETPERRADLLIGASRAAVLAGEPRWAGELLAEARATDPVRGDGIDARRVEVRLAAAAGRAEEASRLADEADAALGAVDPIGVAEVLGEAARPLLPVNPVEAERLARRAWELAGDAPPPACLYAEVQYGCARFAMGDEASARTHTARWRELLVADGPVVAGPFLAETYVLYLGKSYRPVEGLAILDEIEGALRATCASGALVSVLSARSYLSYGIDLRDCSAAAREALELSEDTGQRGLSPIATTTAALAAASVGDGALVAELTDRLITSQSRFDRVWGRAALGRYHLVEGRNEEAVAQFALGRETAGEVNDTGCVFEPDEADALVRVGRTDDARARLPDLEAMAPFGPWALGQYERVQALVADDLGDALAHFEAAATALAKGDNKIASGIAELNWGERLRKAKRRAEARRHLDRAIELFSLVGATGWRRRAEAELAAAGGTGDRSKPTEELLAPLELQVARLAVGGSTNRDIANQLFLSPRTVENHLGAVYRKLGVSGRPALLAKAADDPALRPVSHEPSSDATEE